MHSTLSFEKYQATGNDFIIVDNRALKFDKNNKLYIKQLCDRKFGIGADGFMLLEEQDGFDFKMVYYNADGNESSMCGNGGRAMVKYARTLNLFEYECNFLAVDGPHYAKISEDTIFLQMINVEKVNQFDGYLTLDTGSPHYISFIQNLNEIDVEGKGRTIRWSDAFKENGINVNFVEEIDANELFVRTFERGVEAETLSCGTGVTAAALAYAYKHNLNSDTINIQTLGGSLSVSFVKVLGKFENIFLVGPAYKVFKGNI